ncbi:MAG: hypothetical protein WC511_02490 [Candidatus Pacearchaeota archaeon]
MNLENYSAENDMPYMAKPKAPFLTEKGMLNAEAVKNHLVALVDYEKQMEVWKQYQKTKADAQRNLNLKFKRDAMEETGITVKNLREAIRKLPMERIIENALTLKGSHEETLNFLEDLAIIFNI